MSSPSCSNVWFHKHKLKHIKTTSFTFKHLLKFEAEYSNYSDFYFFNC